MSHMRFNCGKHDHSQKDFWGMQRKCGNKANKKKVHRSKVEGIKNNFRVNKIQVWSTWILKGSLIWKNVDVKWCVTSNTIFYYGKQSLLNKKHVEKGIEQLFQVWKYNNFPFTTIKKKDESTHGAIYIKV